MLCLFISLSTKNWGLKRLSLYLISTTSDCLGGVIVPMSAFIVSSNSNTEAEQCSQCQRIDALDEEMPLQHSDKPSLWTGFAPIPIRHLHKVPTHPTASPLTRQARCLWCHTQHVQHSEIVGDDMMTSLKTTSRRPILAQTGLALGQCGLCYPIGPHILEEGRTGPADRPLTAAAVTSQTLVLPYTMCVT